MVVWNRFSQEVQEERRRLRDYGLDNIDKFPRASPTSYKQQALREHARRLELEVELVKARSEVREWINKYERLEEELRCLKER